MRQKTIKIADIIKEIKNNQDITEAILAKKYNCTERTIRRYFKILKSEGKIIMIRKGKNRYWKVL